MVCRSAELGLPRRGSATAKWDGNKWRAVLAELTRTFAWTKRVSPLPWLTPGTRCCGRVRTHVKRLAASDTGEIAVGVGKVPPHVSAQVASGSMTRMIPVTPP